MGVNPVAHGAEIYLSGYSLGERCTRELLELFKSWEETMAGLSQDPDDLQAWREGLADIVLRMEPLFRHNEVAFREEILKHLKT